MEDYGCIINLIIIVVVIALGIVAISIFCPIGFIFGSGISIGNYFKSFSQNVRIEKPSI